MGKQTPLVQHLYIKNDEQNNKNLKFLKERFNPLLCLSYK